MLLAIIDSWEWERGEDLEEGKRPVVSKVGGMAFVAQPGRGLRSIRN